MSSQAFERAMRESAAAHERLRAAAAAEVLRTPPRRGLQYRSNFKAAEVSRLTGDWIASLLAPNQELYGDLRTMRARAREMARNNGHVGSYLDDLKINILGPFGMRLRARTRDLRENLVTEANDKIEAGWNRFWTGPVSADGTLSGLDYEELALETVGKEGEAFPRRLIGPEFRYGLALQLVDPDLVDDDYNLQGPGLEREVYLGVEVDRLGRRLAYHVLDRPYGPGASGKGRQRIPAYEMLHPFRAARANQMRGITWLSRAMDRLKNEERFEQNVLVASAAGAGQMAVIENSGDSVPRGAVLNDSVTDGAAAGGEGATSSSSSSGPRVLMESEPGSVLELGIGQKLSSYTPDQPSTTFGDFTSVVLRAAAASLGVSYESLTRDFSQVTYLSARAAFMIERLAYQRLQQWWIRSFRQPVFEWWLETAILSGELDLPGRWEDYREVEWKPRGWQTVDPLKDGQADALMLDRKLTTHSRILATRGDDFEDLLEELQKERQLAARYGVSLDPPAGAEGKAARVPASSSGGGTDDDPDAGEGDEDDDAPARPSKNGAGKRGASRVRA